VCAGFVLAALAPNLWVFGLAHGLLLGLLGGASTFAPLMADTSLWWSRRRGIAVAICASGNYVAGAVWPPLAQWGIDHFGWRPTYAALGLFCGAGMLLLALRMRQRPPAVAPDQVAAGAAAPAAAQRPFGLPPGQAQWLLCVAGAARGAQMLSLMLAAGIASRLVSGWICDRIGGIRTLLLGSALQGLALLLFLPFDGLVPLYVISALFGLFQGGIVPSYAIIVREHFPAREAGARVGAVIMATLVGMALGGWLSGWIFDLTGSYRAAFINGIGWNLLNLCIAGWLYRRVRGRGPQRVAA
jgi:MFS family permease